MSSSKFTRVVDLRPSLQPVNVQFIVLEKGARAGRRGVCHWRRRSVWRVCTDVSRALRPQGAVAVIHTHANAGVLNHATNALPRAGETKVVRRQEGGAVRDVPTAVALVADYTASVQLQACL